MDRIVSSGHRKIYNLAEVTGHNDQEQCQDINLLNRAIRRVI